MCVYVCMYMYVFEDVKGSSEKCSSHMHLVCVCMYVYVCAHTYTYTYIRTPMHTYTYTYIRTHAWVCGSTGWYQSCCMYTCTDTHACIVNKTCIHASACIARVLKNKSSYIYTETKHIHTCSCMRCGSELKDTRVEIISMNLTESVCLGLVKMVFMLGAISNRTSKRSSPNSFPECMYVYMYIYICVWERVLLAIACTKFI